MHTEHSESAAIAKRVRTLMERNAIGERKQCGALGRILGLSFSAAYRKLNGESPWTVLQIKQVAAHYKESPSALLESLADSTTSSMDDMVQEAVFVMGAKEIPCLAWIGKPLVDGQPAEFVALENQGKWRVVEMSLALEGQPLFDVEKIEIHPKQISKLIIAVIDDDVGTADNVSEYLNAIGFKAIAFYNTATAAAAVHHQVFDGYVVDWLIGKETAEGLIQTIRSSSNPHAPIILLTGEILTGKVNETEVARLMRRFDVLCQEKPTRLPIIAVELSKALGLN